MTAHDDKAENSSSEPVEPKIEFMSPARGTYAALQDTQDSVLLFDRFLEPNREPYPDIDGNFVDGDRRRKEFLDTLSGFYGNAKQGTSDSAMDGYSTKEEVVEKARNAGTAELNATLYKILYL